MPTQVLSYTRGANEGVETVVWEGDAVPGLDQHRALIDKLRRKR